MNTQLAVSAFIFTFSFLFSPVNALAQGMMSGSCPMCGAMGWGSLILGGILVLAIISALVALTIYLVRRSRPPHSGIHS